MLQNHVSLTWIALKIFEVDICEVVSIEVHSYPNLLFTAIYLVINWKQTKINNFAYQHVKMVLGNYINCALRATHFNIV